MTVAFADHSIKNTWGYTYFVRRGDLIKIGHTGAPKERIYALGKPIDVLAVVPNTIIDEPSAHRKFLHLRVEGEWFSAAPDLLAFIDWANGEANAMPKRKQIVRNTEFDEMRAGMIARRASVGARSPEGMRLSTAIEILTNLATCSSDEVKATLQSGLATVVREIEQIQLDGGKYIPANHGAHSKGAM